MGLSVNALVLAVISGLPCAGAFVAPTLEQGQSRSTTLQMRENRRAFFVNAAATIAGTVLLDPLVAYGEAGADTMPDSLDVNDFLRKGQVSQPMGVSGQVCLLLDVTLDNGSPFIHSGGRDFPMDNYVLQMA